MTFDVQRAASLLIEGRQHRRLIEPFAPGPTGPEDAYAVQDVVAERLGRVGGWKVGARAPGETPNAAPLLSGLMRSSPGKWASESLHMIGIEAEIAFRIGRDIEPRSEPLSHDEVWASLDSVHAAIEIVDTRLANWREADRLWVLADNQSNGGFVYDPDGIAFRHQSLAEAPVRLTVDDKKVAEGRGGNPAGDPRWLVEWLLNHCARHRKGLQAGAMVTTGSYTGMVFVHSGASVEATFDGIGTARASFF